MNAVLMICVVTALPLAASATQASLPSMRSLQPLERLNTAKWQRVGFTELVSRVGAKCITTSPNKLECSGPVHLDSLSQISIDGEGTQVEFLSIEPGNAGISMHNANGVRLANITISWRNGGARAPGSPGQQRLQTFAKVAGCASGIVGGALTADFPLEGSIPLNTVSIWDDALGWPWYNSSPDKYEINFPPDFKVDFSKGHTECIPRLAQLVGRRVLMRHLYTNHAFSCEHCKDTIVEGVRITSAPGMGFAFGAGSSHVILRNNVIAPSCSPNCSVAEPSIFADGAHFAGDSSGIVVEGNDFGWNGDDSVNVTGLMIPVQPDSSSQGWATTEVKWWGGRDFQLSAGTKVLLFDKGLNSLGEGVISAVNSSAHSLKISGMPTGSGGVVVVAPDYIPRDILIRNNYFHDHRARGILLGGTDAIVEANRIERLTGAAILIPADTGPNFEGPGAANVLIRNNSITSVNRHPNLPDYPSAISAGIALDSAAAIHPGTPIQHILVEKNTLRDIFSSPQKPISFGPGVIDSKAVDNR
jgi:hypothetical protein